MDTHHIKENSYYYSLTLYSPSYIYIGTGVGVGLVINNQSVKGLMHPEAGHIQVKRKNLDVFQGTCPFHSDCIEGMCSSGALVARYNQHHSNINTIVNNNSNNHNINNDDKINKNHQYTIHDLPLIPDDDMLWDTCSYYIAQLCVHLVLIASPELIYIGMVEVVVMVMMIIFMILY